MRKRPVPLYLSFLFSLFSLFFLFSFTSCEELQDLTNPDDTGAIPKPAPEISLLAGNGQIEVVWTKIETATSYELGCPGFDIFLHPCS